MNTPVSCMTKPQLLKHIKALESETSRLRHELTQEVAITVPDSTEPEAVNLPGVGHYRIYIVWTVGTYNNGVKHLDIRSITTDERLAKLHSKILRRDKTDWGDTFERVVIEPRVANHLYGREFREMMVNTGKM